MTTQSATVRARIAPIESLLGELKTKRITAEQNLARARAASDVASVDLSQGKIAAKDCLAVADGLTVANAQLSGLDQSIAKNQGELDALYRSLRATEAEELKAARAARVAEYRTKLEPLASKFNEHMRECLLALAEIDRLDREMTADRSLEEHGSYTLVAEINARIVDSKGTLAVVQELAGQTAHWADAPKPYRIKSMLWAGVPVLERTK
jgi:hypothetical protein